MTGTMLVRIGESILFETHLLGILMTRILIVRDPRIMGGKPVVKGTRVTVEAILRRLASGLSVEDLLKEYPQLTEKDVRAALEYAARMLEEGIEIEDEVLS